MAGLLHPQLETTGDVCLRLGQLLIRNGLIAETCQLVEDGEQRRAELSGIDAGGDCKCARVGVVDDSRTDVVREALLFAHLPDEDQRPLRLDRPLRECFGDLEDGHRARAVIVGAVADRILPRRADLVEAVDVDVDCSEIRRRVGN